MKELTKKSKIWRFIVADILISVIVATAIYILYIFCITRRYDVVIIKPTDKLSRAVRKATGKDFFYLGKEESDSGVTEYEYEIRNLDKDAITDLVNALNEAVENEQRKITVQVYLDVREGLSPAFSVDNFSDDGLKVADYGGMYAACIRKSSDLRDTDLDSPSIYSGIEGIRKLCINTGMEKQAEKEGIDWYELWPDLEEIEVIDW